ncbi:SigE family RNA polymerase sigma factor [Dactylosporangium siamense]|uniref:DNA-directed RNA polymerase sigma-70 factor n=1 Tax=Dactylosporangium siamense TaxID=685454 RepID=A0A919PDC5_9ACTN|nr:SigE family RNA polymerase sigma factor [Dactylosporangium siamense]GIG42112.1 DNA-directed RNA polymerase sigma-70 factor [Dactylosporangium siamense]
MVARTDADFTDYFAARAAPLRRFAFALCGDWHTADDLVQATFVKLYQHWRRVEPESLDAYVRRILVNTFLSHRRDRRRETLVADPPDAASDVNRDQAVGQGVDQELGRALQRLPERQRAAVVLRHLEDMSITEVADLLGMAEGTVKSQTARGVDALRRALGAPTTMKE